MTIQDQYTSTLRKSQETWAGVMETLTENVQKAFGTPANPFTSIDPTAAIDQVFDFWERTLEVQRDVAKQLVGATVAASEKVRSQAETVGAAFRDQAASVYDAANKQTTKTYDGMTKAELQDELAKRDLPKTGNVDELRERLIADDLL
ncbi:MAG: colicin import rane protein [Nocardioidaceae bacterium]|jgi:hypothetical protein|nr:colicin import rane protein [Nocardioidaceae bacterium]